MFRRLTRHCACYRSPKPSTIWRALVLSKRYTSSTSHTDETISIPVGGNGSINLKISRPTRPANNNNVLVYLPPGPFLDSSRRDTQILDASTLRDAFPTTTIIDLQYRVSLRNSTPPITHTRSKRPQRNDPSLDHRFPTPIHDVFTAWEYITDELQLYNHDLVDGKKVYYRPRICLVGSHVGGTLALSLALANPNVICAVAVVDVVGDWTGIDEVVGEDRDGDVGGGGGSGMSEVEGKEKEKERKRGRNAKREKEKNSERERVRLAAKELMKLRGRLFRSHSGYFDAFASPMLFLRAPGRDTPVDGDVGLGGGGVLMRYGEEVDEVGVIVDDIDVGAGQAFGPYDDDWVARGYEEVHGSAGDRKGESEIGQLNTSGEVDSGVVVVQVESGAATVSDSSSTADTSASSTSSDQDSISTSITSPHSPSSTPPPLPTSSPRRRKVLRRWPPTAQPEDVILPYINLYTTNPSLPSSSSSSHTSPIPTTNDHDHDHNRNDPQPIDITPITTLQAQELQDLLRKACFWGREKNLAEERVVTTKLGRDENNSEGGVEDERGGEKDSGSGSAVGDEGGKHDRERIVRWLQTRFDEDL